MRAKQTAWNFAAPIQDTGFHPLLLTLQPELEERLCMNRPYATSVMYPSMVECFCSKKNQTKQPGVNMEGLHSDLHGDQNPLGAHAVLRRGEGLGGGRS